MNVLVVDDHVVGRRLLRAHFEAEHINVFEAADGVEALATLRHDHIDAVIADILMPRMDGYRLCHEIRSDERLRDTPIVIYSATYTSVQDEKLACEMGADRFLRKPAPPAVLIATVRECANATRAHAPPGLPPAELAVMRNYSARLVAKLEERNLELEEARIELREANALLEWRVQRRTEELAAANEQLESFASFVAHEVRGPLRAIGAYARQLQDEGTRSSSAHIRRCAEMIATTAGRTEQLTDALLRFCHLGAQPLRQRHLNLNDVVRAAIQALQQPLRERPVEMVVHQLPWCNGDPLLLEHVFTNLLDNAIKFTRNRQDPRVEIGAVSDADMPQVYVRDNGVGFDMRFAHLVFEPFQQLHRDAGFDGAGLGLNLVRNIMVRHGGAIRVESAVNQGTTFYLSFAGVPQPVAVAESFASA